MEVTRMSTYVWDFDHYHRTHLKYLILVAAADKLNSRDQLYHSLLNTARDFVRSHILSHILTDIHLYFKRILKLLYIY